MDQSTKNREKLEILKFLMTGEVGGGNGTSIVEAKDTLYFFGFPWEGSNLAFKITPDDLRVNRSRMDYFEMGKILEKFTEREGLGLIVTDKKLKSYKGSPKSVAYWEWKHPIEIDDSDLIKPNKVRHEPQPQPEQRGASVEELLEAFTGDHFPYMATLQTTQMGQTRPLTQDYEEFLNRRGGVNAWTTYEENIEEVEG